MANQVTASGRPGWWTTRQFALIAMIAAAVPLLWPPLPPLTDLPVQLGRYRVMLGGPDAGLLGQWYEFSWRPIGYLGVDLLVAAMAPIVGLELALKAIVIAIPVSMTAAMLWLSHEVHGRVQPMALLALPFAYHLAFQFGFLNYSLSIALTLAGLTLWIRLARRQRFAARAVLFVGIGFAVWTAHVVGWVVLCLTAFAAEVARRRAGGSGWMTAAFRAGIECLPIALPAAMFLVWQPGGADTGSDWIASLALKPGWLVMALRDRWRWFDVGSMLLVALLLYRAVRSRDHALAPSLAISAALLLLLFVLLPFGSAYGDARIAALIWIAALLAVRSDAASAREQAVLALIGLTLLTVRTAAATASFAMESHVWFRHLAAIDHIPRGSRLLTLVEVPCAPAWRLPRTVHLPSVALARRAAFANDQPDLGSASLLRVTAPGIAGFANDPSQIVVDRPCPQSPEFRTIRVALSAFPRDRFDHVWLIDTDPRVVVGVHGVRPVWRSGRDFLLAVDPPRLSAVSSPD